MREKVAAVFIVMIILASTGAVVAANSTIGGDENGSSLKVSGTANVTFGLLKVVDRLANYTTKLINSSNVSNETLAIYSRANELREKAWDEYRAGNRTVAVRYAVEAMHLYKEVIMTLNRGEVVGNERKKEASPWVKRWKLQNAARVELEMAVRELKYAELIMNRTNVSPEFMRAYNQTKELVEKVREDLASGNFTRLRVDFPKLVKARAELYRQIVLTTSKTFWAQAIKSAGRQLRALDELFPRLIGINKNLVGNISQIKMNMNTTNLTEEIEELKVLRDELKQAMMKGDHERVVELLREINRKLLEIRILMMRYGRIKELPWRPPIAPNPGRRHDKAHSSRRP